MLLRLFLFIGFSIKKLTLHYNIFIHGLWFQFSLFELEELKHKHFRTIVRVGEEGEHRTTQGHQRCCWFGTVRHILRTTGNGIQDNILPYTSPRQKQETHFKIWFDRAMKTTHGNQPVWLATAGLIWTQVDVVGLDVNPESSAQHNPTKNNAPKTKTKSFLGYFWHTLLNR